MVSFCSANDKLLPQTVELDVYHVGWLVGFFLSLFSVKNLETGRSTRGVKMFFDHEIVNGEAFHTTLWGTGIMPALLSAF